MTTKAKPQHYFVGIKFNTSFFDTEIDKTLKNYVNYDPTNLKLISNVNYIPTTIIDLNLSGSIGSSTAQKFILPSNSSTGTLNSVLTLSNISTKATTWTQIPTQITNYTNYDNTAKTIISNVSGTPSTIIDLNLSGSIGSSTAQKFILPSNSSTGTLNSVLTLSNISTKATTWTTIPTQITNYVNYSNPNLISNISGVPTNISNLTVGPLICTTINTNNNTITSGSGSITSTGLIKGGSFQNTAGSMTVASNGSMTGLTLTLNGVAGVSCYNLDIRNSFDNSYRGSINGLMGLFELKGDIECVGFYIKNFISNTTIAYINGTGDLSCNTINTNNNTITSGPLVCTTINTNNNTITSGSLSCTTINTNNNTITSGPLVCTTINTNNNTITSGSLSCTTINTNNNTISSGSGSITSTGAISGGSILSSIFNSTAIGSVLDIGANQTTASLSIGNNASRTGSINIATIVTGSQSINIGNSSSTQIININRPIRLPGLTYSNGNEIGYSQNNSITFFSPTNPVLPGTLMNTPITTTNLINNANYLIKYSLVISPQASFNVTKLQYGLYTTAFVTSCNNNHSVHSTSSTVTTSIRLLSTDVYSYSGSGFFKYNSATSYSFTYYIDFLATAPIIVTNIDLIRIS